MPRGFTLIELLVVIAIIGMLASVVLASLQAARAKGRDARRLEDLKQIQTAIELYYNDNNAYPNTSSAWVYSTQANPWIPGLTSNYIPELPKDPTNVGSPELIYYYNSDGQNYCIQISQENSGATTNLMYWGNWSGSYKLRLGAGSPTQLTWCQTH